MDEPVPQVKPQPLQPETAKPLTQNELDGIRIAITLKNWPGTVIARDDIRRLLATIDEARREQPVRVTDEMVDAAIAAWRSCILPGTSQPLSYGAAMEAAIIAALAAAPKEGL